MAIQKLEDTTKKNLSTVTTALKNALKPTVTPTVTAPNLLAPKPVTTTATVKPTTTAMPIYQPTPVTTITAPKTVATPAKTTPSVVYQPTPSTQITSQGKTVPPTLASSGSKPTTIFQPVQALDKELPKPSAQTVMSSFRDLEQKTATYPTPQPTQKTAPAPTPAGANEGYVDTSSEVAQLNAELQSILNEYENQRKQLEATYGLNSEEYNIQLRQLTDDYNLSKSQLDQQLAEQEGATTKEAQQAYIQKMQSQRVAKNILASQGLGQTGYEWLTGRKREEAYQGTVGSIMQNYQNALNQINRTRQAQQQAFAQNQENVGMAQRQSALGYQQNLENISMAQQKAQADYQAGLKSIREGAQKTQQNLLDNRATMFSNVTQAIGGGAKFTEVKSALDTALSDNSITKTAYNDIYRYAVNLYNAGR